MFDGQMDGESCVPILESMVQPMPGEGVGKDDSAVCASSLSDSCQYQC